MSFLYRNDIEKSPSLCRAGTKYLKQVAVKKGNNNLVKRAKAEYCLRYLCDMLPRTEYDSSHKLLKKWISSKGFQKDDLGQAILKIICSEVYFNSNINQIDNIITCHYNELRVELAIATGDYFARAIKKENIYYNENFEEQSYSWYKIALDIDDSDFCKFRCGKGMFLLNDFDIRKRGLELLEEASFEIKEAGYIVGSVYMAGDFVKRDYYKAFHLFEEAKTVVNEAYLEIGKMRYYGWGCDADLALAIEALEKYKEIYDKNNSSECIAFLVECYYEDVLLNNSDSSLEKLMLLADYYDSRMACKYLYWYYSDCDNLYQDIDSALKYKQRLNGRDIKESIDKKVDMECAKLALDLAKITYDFEDEKSQDEFVENLFENNKTYCKKIIKKLLTYWTAMEAFKSISVAEFVFRVSDHLFTERGLKSDNGNNIIEYLFIESEKVYYHMAKLFFHGDGVDKNDLRAEIYLKNYLKAVTLVYDGKNYIQALKLYGHLLSKYPEKSYLKRKSKGILLRAKMLEKKELKLEYLQAFQKIHSLNLAENKVEEYIPYCEDALELGAKVDYSRLGLYYLTGYGICANDKKGFYWLDRFYQDYQELELCPEINYEDIDIFQVEYNLGVCYAAGIGTSPNLRLALELWKKAMLRCPKGHLDLIVILSICFRKGEIQMDDGETIKIEKNRSLAFYGFKQAAEAGNEIAIQNLIEMYQNGECGIKNIAKASELRKNSVALIP